MSQPTDVNAKCLGPLIDYEAALEAFEERLDAFWSGSLGEVIDDPCVRSRYVILERRRLRLRRWLEALRMSEARVVPERQLSGLWSDLRAAWTALEGVVSFVLNERSESAEDLRLALR